MTAFGKFDVNDSDRLAIYRYVDRHGIAKPREVAEAVGLEPEAFRHHLSILKRDGYLEEDGQLRVTLETGEAEEHTAAGLQFVIRPARQEDFAGVLGAIRAATEPGKDLVAESVAEQLQYEETLLRHNAAETRLFFVATVSNDVVGWCHVEVPRLAKLADTAEVALGVLEEYRRYGIGSHLLQRARSWASANDLRKLYNSLPATNEDGIAFLEENGAHVEARRHDHFQIDGELVDEVMLAMDL
jgi:GNAT superfamily N-acetyltransferase